ncbi:MAG: pyridoxal 5'-phosphate synthase glutaminase subunit PdxT [Myxococcota bacterium]|nr:pyridoxal 5'-phosphate synthase glutaminase subunit PdxT [Myxococcota bacterium]
MQGEAGRVGVLAIQGAVDKHRRSLERVGADAVPVLHKKDLVGLKALILPGGESTTIAKGLTRLDLWEPIREFAKSGGGVLGTCAGAILLARTIENHPVPSLGLMDITAVRNAYGTQVDSFTAPSDPGGKPELAEMRCVFIRAPRLSSPGPDVEVLLRVDGAPVLARQGNVLASTFHPELGDDDRLHRLLLGL